MTSGFGLVATGAEQVSGGRSWFDGAHHERGRTKEGPGDAD